MTGACTKCGAEAWGLTTPISRTARWVTKDGTRHERTYVYDERYRCGECGHLVVINTARPQRSMSRNEIDAARRAKYDAQGGRCAICQREIDWSRAVLDHDHECCPNPNRRCGRCERGVLCSPCNTGLGMLGEDIDRLLGAIAYLNEHRREEEQSA